MPAPPAWTLGEYVHTGYWWKNRGILILNLFLILPLLTACINGLDSSLVNGLQLLPSWQEYYHYPDGKTLGLINSAQNIGALGGLPFTPFVSDRFGRRCALFLGAFIMLCGIITQLLAKSANVFIVARVVIGVGLSFSVNAAPLLITELAYPTQRGKLTSLFNTAWYGGSVISAWTCFAAYTREGSSDWSWRVPTMVQAGAPILQMTLIWFVPESPRFLVAKGMESKAAKILAKYHANSGDEHDPLIVFEMAQIRHALKLEKEINENSTFWQLWTRPGNLKRLRIIVAIAMFSQWSGNGLVSYYINIVLDSVGITSTNTKTAINGGLQVWNLLCAMTGAFLVDRIGRRPLFIVSTVGMFVVFCMWTLTTALVITTDNKAAAKATVPIIFVFYTCYDICFTPLIVSYTLEILPYSIRAKGFAIMVSTMDDTPPKTSDIFQNCVLCITQAFNQFVNPLALNAIGWKFYLFYCAWLLVEISFILRYIVETRGRTLEETAALFDGEKPEMDMVMAGGNAAATIASFNVNQSKSGIPMALMTQKSGDWGPEEWLEHAMRQSYTQSSIYDDYGTRQSTDSRRQSQESDIAVAGIAF